MPLQDPLMQNAALQDLCFLAEATGPDAWRRKMVFDKDSGETWRQVSIVCMDEVSFSSYSRTPLKQNTKSPLPCMAPGISLMTTARYDDVMRSVACLQRLMMSMFVVSRFQTYFPPTFSITVAACQILLRSAFVLQEQLVCCE